MATTTTATSSTASPPKATRPAATNRAVRPRGERRSTATPRTGFRAKVTCRATAFQRARRATPSAAQGCPAALRPKGGCRRVDRNGSARNPAAQNGRLPATPTARRTTNASGRTRAPRTTPFGDRPAAETAGDRRPTRRSLAQGRTTDCPTRRASTRMRRVRPRRRPPAPTRPTRAPTRSRRRPARTPVRLPRRRRSTYRRADGAPIGTNPRPQAPRDPPNRRHRAAPAPLPPGATSPAVATPTGHPLTHSARHSKRSAPSPRTAPRHDPSSSPKTARSIGGAPASKPATPTNPADIAHRLRAPHPRHRQRTTPLPCAKYARHPPAASPRARTGPRTAPNRWSASPMERSSLDSSMLVAQQPQTRRRSSAPPR